MIRLLMALCLACALPTLLWAQPGDQRLDIIEAIYGTDRQSCAATQTVVNYCQNQTFCEFEATNELCGDPHRGERKTAFVRYSCGDGLRTLEVEERQLARLYCLDARQTAGAIVRPGSRNRNDVLRNRQQRWQQNFSGVEIVSADYGVYDRWCDAAPAVGRLCNGRDRCEIDVRNDLCPSDPARGEEKRLEVRYRCDGGDVVFRDAREYERLNLYCK